MTGGLFYNHALAREAGSVPRQLSECSYVQLFPNFPTFAFSCRLFHDLALLTFATRVVVLMDLTSTLTSSETAALRSSTIFAVVIYS